MVTLRTVPSKHVYDYARERPPHGLVFHNPVDPYARPEFCKPTPKTGWLVSFMFENHGRPVAYLDDWSEKLKIDLLDRAHYSAIVLWAKEVELLFGYQVVITVRPDEYGPVKEEKIGL